MKQIFLITGLVVALAILAMLGARVEARDRLPQATAPEGSQPIVAVAEPVEPTDHPILSDIRVRQAIAYCTDKDALLVSVYPDLTPQQRQALIANTFIPTASWAYTSPSVVYPYDPATGQSLLDQAGWTLPPGGQYRMRDGRELALTVRTTQAAFRVTFLTVWEAQLRSCGIRLMRDHLPFTWWFGAATGLGVRDFELGAYSWVIPTDDPGGRTLFACDQVPAATNGWAGQNYPGWCNPVASDAIIQATNPTLPQAVRRAYYSVVIEYLASDLPVLPLFWRANDDGTPSEAWEHVDINLETYVQQTPVQPGAATVLYTTDHMGNEGSIALPAGAVTEMIDLGYAPLLAPIHDPDEGLGTAVAFRLTAFSQGVPLSSFTFSQPVTVTVPYSAPNLQSILDESSLDLYFWDGTAWQPAVETCPPGQQYQLLDTENDLLVARVCHLSEFDLIGLAAWCDFDGDGDVDVDDISTIAGLWGQPAEPPFDPDGDGWITIVDIMLAARWWGWTAP